MNSAERNLAGRAAPRPALPRRLQIPPSPAEHRGFADCCGDRSRPEDAEVVRDAERPARRSRVHTQRPAVRTPVASVRDEIGPGPAASDLAAIRGRLRLRSRRARRGQAAFHRVHIPNHRRNFRSTRRRNPPRSGTARRCNSLKCTRPARRNRRYRSGHWSACAARD